MNQSFTKGALAFFLVVSTAGVTQATDVLPGLDFFLTGPGGAVLDLGGGGTPDPDDDLPALPPDFFFAGSPPVTGVVPFTGVPLGPGCNADTIVERLGPAILSEPPPTSSDTIPIEIVALSLTSVGPITVGATEWDIDVVLSSIDPSPGTMTIFHDDPSGGTFDATIDICALHTFTQVVGPSPGTTLTLENCADLGIPMPVGVVGQPWGHDPPAGPPPCAGAGPAFFVLGPQFDSGPHPAMNPGTSEGELCGDTFPTCDGDCPPGLVCQEDPGGAPVCFCGPDLPVPCGDTFPTCDGDCPPGLVCQEDPSGAPDCLCGGPDVPASAPWGLVATFLALLAGVGLLVSRMAYFRRA